MLHRGFIHLGGMIFTFLLKLVDAFSLLLFLVYAFFALKKNSTFLSFWQLWQYWMYLIIFFNLYSLGKLKKSLCIIWTFDVVIFLSAIIDTYDDNFFELLDGVANALDNIDASMQIDS